MGYRFVKAPPGYPGKRYKCGDRALEHHVVWWQHTGQVVPRGYVLHHRDEQKDHNSFGNLKLLTNGRHIQLHHTKTTLRQQVRCARCGKEFPQLSRIVRFRRKRHQKMYCSRRCSAAMTCPTRQVIAHGEYGRYRKGCRCRLCRQANAQRMQKYIKGLARGARGRLASDSR